MRDLNAEENLLISGGFLASDPGGDGTSTTSSNWVPGSIVRYNQFGVWLDTGTTCVFLRDYNAQGPSAFTTLGNWVQDLANRCSISGFTVGSGSNITFSCVPPDYVPAGPVRNGN